MKNNIRIFKKTLDFIRILLRMHPVTENEIESAETVMKTELKD